MSVKSLVMALAIGGLFSAHAQAALRDIVQEGDLIFQENDGEQSEAVVEVQSLPRPLPGSRYTHVGIIEKKDGQWFVLEALKGVMRTPLSLFILHGSGTSNYHYVIKRLKPGIKTLTAGEKNLVQEKAASFLKAPYDTYFEWSDDAIYCTELVWKAYQRGIHFEIVRTTLFGDLDLTGPKASKLLKDRYTDENRTFNPNEPIVTVQGMFDSPLLETVTEGFGVTFD